MSCRVPLPRCSLHCIHLYEEQVRDVLLRDTPVSRFFPGQPQFMPG